MYLQTRDDLSNISNENHLFEKTDQTIQFDKIAVIIFNEQTL